MLARTFLTARQLKISEIEKRAAFKLLEMLERGNLKFIKIAHEHHVQYHQLHYRTSAGQDILAKTPDDPRLAGSDIYFVGFVGKQEVRRVAPHDGGLNMSVWREVTAGPFCGCIGGWIEFIKGRPLSERMEAAFDDVFEPPIGPLDDDWHMQPELFTPERCARALYAKLTTGKADWS